MDILAPELIDLARERGSAFVAIAVPTELFEYGWDSTDARWEEILNYAEVVAEEVDPILYVGVVTEGVTIDNQTYEMLEHLNVTVITPAGYECWKIPIDQEATIQETVISLGELPPEELDFDIEALQAILPWN